MFYALTFHCDYGNPDPYLTESIRADGANNMGDAPTCSHCGQYTDVLRWLPPYEVEIELLGRGFGDVVEQGRHLLVSERFVSLWNEHGLTGLGDFNPAEVTRVTGLRGRRSQLPQYYYTRVERGPTLIDYEASGFEFELEPNEKICLACGNYGGVKRWQRVVFKPNTWDGDDLFKAHGWNTIFASQRFADFCKQFNITNAPLIPIDRYAHDFYPWEHNT